MKRRYCWGIGIMMVALLSVSPAFAEREKLLPENLLSELGNKLKLADQELAELKPAVEKKSKEVLNALTLLNQNLMNLKTLIK